MNNSAWKAVQSVAMVTGYEVPGRSNCNNSAWNFRASERRAELVRAMPSAAENLEEEALQSEAMVTGDEVLGRKRLH